MRALLREGVADMSERIILVIDGGVASAAALARTLARAASVELDERHSAIDESGTSQPQHEGRLDEAEALSRAAAQFTEASPQSKVEVVILRGAAVDRFARESEGTDVVVVGSHSVGALAGVFDATIPLGLLPRSSCPVVIVPTAWAPSLGPVVGGVDEPTWIAAHEFAAREAERLDRELLLVRAWELPPMVTTELLGAGSVNDAIRDADAELHDPVPRSRGRGREYGAGGDRHSPPAHAVGMDTRLGRSRPRDASALPGSYRAASRSR
jgi:hypothetical protein